MISQTKNSKGKPLGYIQLESGVKPVAVMNDIFLNYQFENPENWEDLRNIVNIFVNGYAAKNPSTVAKPILGAIDVQTQYKFLLNPANKTRNQDFKVSGDEFTYIEFQNRANVEPSIEIRASEYFGLGIGHSGGKLSNQIWLLAEDADSVLVGEPYTNYILMDEVTGTKYPNPSGLLFVSLTKLAKESSPAGELASFLLGVTIAPEEIKDSEVSNIAKNFQAGFSVFQADKEAKRVMTVQERFTNEGRFEGRVEGKAEAALEMLNDGVPMEKVAQYTKMPLEWVERLQEKLA